MEEKLYLSRLQVGNYDLQVVGHSKEQNKEALYIEATEWMSSSGEEWTVEQTKEHFPDCVSAWEIKIGEVYAC